MKPNTAQNELIRNLGIVVRVARVSRSWSQDELAQRTALRRNAICNLEVGNTVPHLLALANIARAFDVTLTQLVHAAEKNQPTLLLPLGTKIRTDQTKGPSDAG